MEIVIPVNLPMRGFSNWYEYARHTRTVHVEQRACGIGYLYVAYLPAGYVVTNPDLKATSDLAASHGCPRIEVVAAPRGDA
jgi:hypothetical protein